MRTALRWAGYGAGSLIVLALAAAAYVWIASERLLGAVDPKPERLVEPSAAMLANAERRARTLGCNNCHGDDLQGRRFFHEPGVATVYAPNLREVASRASAARLARAIRQGIGVDGGALIMMPSESYQYLTDEETSALVAFLKGLPNSGQRTPDRVIHPQGRVGLAIGVVATAPKLNAEYRKKPAPTLGTQHALGRHLAMTTCSGCHGSDLAGGKFAVKAPDLAIAGAYDLPAFRKLLREGIAPGGKKLGLMREIALKDARHYTDDEIARLHAYLVARAQKQP